MKQQDSIDQLLLDIYWANGPECDYEKARRAVRKWLDKEIKKAKKDHVKNS